MTARPDAARYLTTIERDATDLVDAAESAGLDTPVPSCPDWVVADLLAHVGRVHRWAAGNAVRPPDAEFWSGDEIEIPPPPERPTWVRSGATDLLAVLDRPADEPAWTFVPPHTLGFWHRRQAQETAMHRVDAQLAAGLAPVLDSEFAADGIDELLWLLPRRPWMAPITGGGETVHLHCTDVEGEWLIAFTPDGVDVERRHAKADVAARGAASDVLLWCSGRGPLDALEVFGDAPLLDRFRQATTF
jgi:uncharacterized protein (TIGR03083 family)